MLYTILLFLFVLDAFLLMVVILLQDSKGGGLASGAFGGGGMGTQLLGGRGAATFLSRATTYLGTGFLLLCIILTQISQEGAGVPRSVILDEGTQTEQTIPETGLPLLPGTIPSTPPPSSTQPDTGGDQGQPE